MAEIIRLDNGLRIFYKHHPSSKAFALGVFVGAGSAYETLSEGGIAHFIEHMVFKGTTTRSAFDIANEADSCGITMNAYTSRFFTAFYTIGLAEYADKCASLLSDIYFNPTYTEDNILKEKGVVCEEINMYEDDGEDVCLENLIKTHYGLTPLSRPILGTAKSVKSLDADKIRAFTAKFYRPENTCVAVVGDISSADAVALTEKYFRFPVCETPFVRPVVPTFEPQASFRKKIKSVEQSCVGISFPSFPYNHPLKYVPSIISNVLGGGMSSRLFQEIREKAGLVYEIYATNNQYSDNAYFVIYFATAPSQVTTALTKTRDCLKKVLAEGITEAEFDKALAQLKTGVALGSESASEIMRMGGKFALSDEVVTHETLLEEFSRLDCATVNGALKEILDFSKASLSYVGKKNPDDLFSLFKEGSL